MLQKERYGPVEALHQGRRLLGIARPLMTVRCYAVDGVLIDTGLSPLARDVLGFATETGVKRALLTHHHEDHSGNVRALQQAGVPVYASEEAGERVRRGFAVHFYQRLAWGSAPPAQPKVLTPVVETGRYRFEVLPAPGHCKDQVVFYERSEGWLFSGDVYLASRIKYFRKDEDFAATLETLRRLVALDFDALFCAHRPVVKGGREALRKKLDYLLDIEGRARELAANGLSVKQIARSVLGPEDLANLLLTAGDVTKRNIIRSILHGPVPRKR